VPSESIYAEEAQIGARKPDEEQQSSLFPPVTSGTSVCFKFFSGLPS